jgi:LysR family transcriptional regulator, regulator for bpeEF and oprC
MDPFSGVLPFLHVAEEKSFRRAAARLGVSTAAVSKAVAKLERELGVTLVERTSRHVSLTTEGDAYAARCREAVDALRAGREVVARNSSVAQGPLRVSVSYVLAPVVIEQLARFTARYPRVTLHLNVSDRIARLAEEEVDVALRTGDLDDSSLVARKLYSPVWMTVASPAYLARRGTPTTPDQLMDHDCLYFVTPRGKPRPFGFRDRPAISPRGQLFVDSGELLLSSAIAGVGVAQVMDFMARGAIREGQLLEILARDAIAGPTIHAVTLPRRKSLPRVRAFLDFVTEVFSALRGVTGVTPV